MARAGGTSKVVRWSQDEVDIVVQITNNQLALEAQDQANTISWSSHWKNVSSRLKEEGYSRSPTACRSVWKRGVEQQLTTREAAGEDWSESEHEILSHMTRKQLDLEDANRSAVIPWVKHWNRVSLQLEERGYERTPEMCAAYWELLEDEAENASHLENEEREVSQPSAPTQKEEDVDGRSPSVAPAIASPQSPKVLIWRVEEYQILLALLRTRRELEQKKGLEQLVGQKLWIEIAKSHQESGYDRSVDACKTFWNQHGRDDSGFDERECTKLTASNPPPNRPTSSCSDKNSSSSPSWSSVDEGGAEDLDHYFIESASNPAIDALRRFQQERFNENHGPDLNTLVVSRSMSPPALDTNHDDQSREHSPGQPEKKYRKKGVKNFRLTAEQRAVLDNEVAQNGSIPTSERKGELAQQLGLEYKTVRNWFANNIFNIKRIQENAGAPNAPDAGLGHLNCDASFQGGEHIFANNPSPATPNAAGLGNNSIPTTNSLKRQHPMEDSVVQEPAPDKTRQEVVSGQPKEIERSLSGVNPAEVPSSQQQSLTEAPSTLASQPQLPPPSTLASQPQLPPPSTLASQPQLPPPSTLASQPQLPPPSTLASQPQLPPAAPLKFISQNVGKDDPGKAHLRPAPMQPGFSPVNQQAALPTPTVYPATPLGNDQANHHNFSNGVSSQSQDGGLRRQSTADDGTAMLHRLQHDMHTRILNVQPPRHGLHGQSTSRAEFSMRREQASEAEKAMHPPVPTQAAQIRAFQAPQNTYAPIGPSPTLQNTEWPTQSHPNNTSAPSRPNGLQQYSERQGGLLPAPRRIASLGMFSAPSPASSFEDIKASARRHIQTLSAEVEHLKHDHAIHSSKVASYSQQLNHSAHKRDEAIRAKQVEINRLTQEVEMRFADQEMLIRQEETWLGSAHEAATGAMKRSATELAKKEKGLIHLQGFLESCDNDGDG